MTKSELWKLQTKYSSKSQSIPNNLSDRINDIINKNESIIGRFNNNTSQAGSRRNSASSSVDHQNQNEQLESQPVRKRAVRGPWRYEVRSIWNLRIFLKCTFSGTHPSIRLSPLVNRLVNVIHVNGQLAAAQFLASAIDAAAAVDSWLSH